MNMKTRGPALTRWQRSINSLRRSLGLSYKIWVGPSDAPMRSYMEAVAHIAAREFDQAERSLGRLQWHMDTNPDLSPALKANALYQMGQLALHREKPDDAQAYLVESLRLHEEIWGEDHAESYLVLDNLAWMHAQRGEHEQALGMIDRAERSWPDMDAIQRARVMTNRGILLAELERLPEAEKALRASIAACRSAKGRREPLADAYRRLATVHLAQSRPRDALRAARRARRYARETDAEVKAVWHNIVASADEGLHRYDAALRHRRAALVLLGSTGSSLSRVSTLRHLAATCEQRGEYQAALEAWEQSLALSLGVAPVEDIILMMGRIADMQSTLGERDKAFAQAREALITAQSALGFASQQTARALMGMAETSGEERRDFWLRQALAALAEAGERHGSASLAWNTAWILSALGEDTQAEHAYREALVHEEQRHGERSLETAAICANFSAVLWQLGQAHEALAFAERAYRTREALQGDHLETMVALVRYARLTLTATGGRPAIDLLRKAQRMGARVGAPGPVHAEILDDMGDAYRSDSDRVRAGRCYARSCRILVRALGSDHPRAVSQKEKLRCWRQHGRFDALKRWSKHDPVHWETKIGA